VSDREQEKAAKRAQWEEINRAKAAAKQKEQEAPATPESRPASPQKQFQAIRGTRDLLPAETALWNRVEETADKVFGTFGFGEIRTPVFESFHLFQRAVGNETDIVGKEMYVLTDRMDGDVGSQLEYLKLAIEYEIVSSSQHADIERFKSKAFEFIDKYAEALEKGLVYRDEFTDRHFGFLKAMKESLTRYPRDTWTTEEQYFFDDTVNNCKAQIREINLTEPKALRPEATASVCRAYIEHGMQQLPQPVKLYYIGPMFRRERPQKGRYRQFYQIGAEVLGGSDAPAIDAEVIEMVMTFFDRLGLTGVELDINSIGHAADNCRRGYVEKLRTALESVKDKLGEDSRRRIETNPLRVLDSKLEHEQAIIATLPKIADHLCDECKTHYAAVKHQLELRGVIYRENWRLVRGLDYYMRTTFEITAKGLGSQNAVCGGGRYDGLVELLGGPPTKGIGFAIGEDRLILSLQESGKGAAAQGRDVYIAWMGERAYATAIRAAKDLRTAGFSVELPPIELKFGKALERADKLGSRYALILGDNEVAEGSWTLKTLADGSQQKFTEPELLEFLRKS
jgi:histidyl-tRNA synthetase